MLVHVRRYEDGVRRVESVAEITGIEGLTPLLQTIFEFRRRGRQDRRVTGEFVATAAPAAPVPVSGLAVVMVSLTAAKQALGLTFTVK